MTKPQVLISGYLHDFLTDDQADELRNWLVQSQEHQRTFARETYIHRCIYDFLVGGNTREKILTAGQESDENNGTDVENIFLEVIEQGEKIAAEHAAKESEQVSDAVREAAKEAAEAAFKKFQEQEQRLNQRFEHERYSYSLLGRNFGLGALAASLIIIVVLVFHFNRKPNIPAVPQVVATLTETLNAKWDDRTLPTAIGSELFAGEMRLIKGYAQITFIDGAELVLQAPVRFKLETAEQIFLRSGRLTAKVPAGAEGFKLNTPNARMIDLGTEFGVIVSEAGQSELHVFRGEVKLFSKKRTGGNIYKQTFQAGQAGMIDKDGQVSKKTYKATPQSFVRSVPKKTIFGRPGERLDLADIIGGGNGFGTGNPNQSINPDNGRTQPGFCPRDYHAARGSCDYVPIVDMDFIDGVFIPSGGDGPVVVSSLGHIFHECPDTNSKFCWDIFCGNITFNRQYLQILNGRRYGTSEHPGISIHSNSGITFDLDKIRTSLGGSRIVAFSALCGMLSKNIIRTYETTADFWVLVDGQKRFEMTWVSWQSRAKPVRIMLTEQDRFLTLMVTDGGKAAKENDANFGDLGLFAEPALTLAPM